MRILVALLLMLPMLAGCLTPYRDYTDFEADREYENPGVFEGDYRFGNFGSEVLRAGKLLPMYFPEVVRMESSLPAFDGPLGAREESKVDIVMAIWRPNTTAPVPIIVDAGPYFEVDAHCVNSGQLPCQQFEDDTIDWPGQRTPSGLANFLPHG
jgi:hypothetical protein